jgi:hypothetical protein
VGGVNVRDLNVCGGGLTLELEAAAAPAATRVSAIRRLAVKMEKAAGTAFANTAAQRSAIPVAKHELPPGEVRTRRLIACTVTRQNVSESQMSIDEKSASKCVY